MTKRLVIVLGLAGLLAAGRATAAPRLLPGPYTVTELKPLKGSVAFAFDVNLAGQATGVMTEETAGSTFFRGFFYDPHTGLVDIGSLGGANTFAERINDHGVVTGSSETGTGTKVHAFVYTPGVGMRDLGAGPADQSFGNDIDEAGNVIGSLFPGDHAFFWSVSGGIRDLGPGTMAGFDYTGTVFGYRTGDNGAVPGFWRPPFTTFTPFGPVPDPFKNGYANSGNVFEDAAGEFSGGGDETAFVWDEQQRRYIMLTPGTLPFSTGESINDAGNVVVRAFDNEQDIPFFYESPTSDPINGNTFNPSGTPFSSLLDFTSIDDLGHIGGAGRVGSEVHGFILTPPFGTQVDTVSRILLQDVPPENPFYKWVQKMRELGITHGVDPTRCYEFDQLRRSLSVTPGVPFGTAQREVAQNAFGALLNGQQCTSGLPTAPVTVPHIFSRKSEREQIAIRILSSRPVTITAQFPLGSQLDVLNFRQTGGHRVTAAVAAKAKLKITKTRTKTSVRVKVSGVKLATLHFTVVAKKLLNGTATPVTTKVAK